MDNNNWRPNPSQGPVVGGGGGVGGGGVGAPGGGGGEAAMDFVDWRSQVQPDSRQRIVNKIMETLKRHLPVSGQEGLHELRKIAIKFEEKIYTAATSQSDYLRKLSLKMLTMETRSQNPIGNALPSNSAGNSNQSPDTGGGGSSGGGGVGGGGVGAPGGGGGEAAMDSVDWRSQLQPDSRQRIVNKIVVEEAKQVSYQKRSRNSSDIAGKFYLFNSLPDLPVASILCKLSPSDFANILLTCSGFKGLVPISFVQPDFRQRIVNKILETLKGHLPVSGQEGLHVFRKIAIRFEGKIYTAATSQSDYLRKISLKMLTMETKSQNPRGNALPSNSAGNSSKSPDAASLDYSTAQTGHANGADWQEKVYQKIETMKDLFLPEISEMYQEIAAKLQQPDSIPQQLKLDQLEKLKTMLEHIITFLQVSKNNILPVYKEKFMSYVKQIVTSVIIYTNRPKKPALQ